MTVKRSAMSRSLMRIDGTEWAPAVRAPRTYGFHATLKAPFFLTNGLMKSNCAARCRTLPPHSRYQDWQIVVCASGSFIALVPLADCTSLGVWRIRLTYLIVFARR